MVPNYSFELYVSCPTHSGNDLNLAIPWLGVTNNSSDYYNTCASGPAGIPNSALGFQYPKTGNGYAGIYAVNGFGSNYREYLQVKLDTSLQQDSCYLVEFYCNLYNRSRYGINKMGALLSPTAMNTVGPGLVLQYAPQIESSTFMDDTLNWMQVRGFYTAQGGEEYLTIGNFRTDALTDTIHVGGSNYNGAYYLIEDVRVQKMTNCDTTVGITDPEVVKATFILYPNPNDGNMVLAYSLNEKSTGTFNLYDVAGRLINKYNLIIGENNTLKITEGNLTNGVYFYSIIVDDKIQAYSKIIVVK
ncbi:MAG: T9SS type A sorting domain-containing protein [Bacteroidia bacterium]|nr:T9SS type A sorting domain-containing protein [Bacteroidia bacterium]